MMAPQPPISEINKILLLLSFFIDRLSQYRKTNTLSRFLVNKAIINLIIDTKGIIDIRGMSEGLLEIRAKPQMFGPTVFLHSPSVFNEDVYLLDVLTLQPRTKKDKIIPETSLDQEIPL